MKSELQLLIDSLNKKQVILQDILDKSRQQLTLAKAEVFDEQAFDTLVDQKAELLESMERLDDGFDVTYQRIRSRLLDEYKQYPEQIGALQQLIQSTIDLGAQIHAAEERTKEQLPLAIQSRRSELTQKKTSMKAVSDYYKKSNNLQYVDAYFMDQKK